MLAAYNNTNPEMITILLELGADLKMKNRYGMTAIEYAKGNKNLTDTDALKKLEEMSR
jgi:ankyrin repeat protein